MKTWNQETKDFFIARAEFAAKNDLMRQGQWLNRGRKKQGVFCGCMHGVATQSQFNVLKESSKSMQWPLWLTYLTEKIFEKLPESDCVNFALDVMKAVPINADISGARRDVNIKRLERVLESQKSSTYSDASEIIAVIENVIVLYKEDCQDAENWGKSRDTAAYANAYANANANANAANAAARAAAEAAQAEAEAAAYAAHKNAWKIEAQALITALKSI